MRNLQVQLLGSEEEATITPWGFALPPIRWLLRCVRQTQSPPSATHRTFKGEDFNCISRLMSLRLGSSQETTAGSHNVKVDKFRAGILHPRSAA